MTPGLSPVGSAPTLAAVVLVGGALVGATLKPALRARSERWLLLPAALVLLVAALAYEVGRHNWLWAALPAILLILWRARLRVIVRRAREASTHLPDSHPPETPPMGTGTET